MNRLITKLIIMALLFATAPSIVFATEGVNKDKENDEPQYIYGTDRYETSIQIANELGTLLEQRGEVMDGTPKTEKDDSLPLIPKGVYNAFDTVVIASGENYADALSGAFLANLTKAPMILVSQSKETRISDYVKRVLKPGGKAYILGGSSAVSSSFEASLNRGKYDIERLYGSNRYETNLKILKKIDELRWNRRRIFFDKNNTNDYSKFSGYDPIVPDTTRGRFLVCSGKNYADAIGVSSVGYPVFLVGDSLTESQKEYLQGGGFYLDIIGGTGAVSGAVETQLKNGVTEVKRYGGKTRFETSFLVASHYFPEERDEVVLVYGNNFPDGLSAGPLAYNYDAPVILVDSMNYKYAVDYCSKGRDKKAIVISGPDYVPMDVAKKCAYRIK